MIPKFRAYNPATNDWYKPEEVFVSDGNIYLDDDDFYELIQNNDVTLMQSTGLFDKNGQEIFEGDVVRMHSGELLPVRLHHGMFEPVCYYVSSVFEKVGNIFENPELTEHPDFREATND
ncbi:TPA: YopX family protein [Streptococcus suis]